MKIAIIGAGFTGLSAAYQLQKNGHEVSVFEKQSLPGGLAIGYKEKGWEWTLEEHYHHWFTNDSSVLTLAKEIGHNVVIVRPHTNWYIRNKIYEFDSVSAALRFSPLSPIDRVRNLATLGFFRLNPLWRPLEKVNATKALPKLMGNKAYSLLWEPLFINKFGQHAQNVSLAWFWACVKKRTQSLAYPVGGFLTFAEHLLSVIEKQGGKIYLNTEILKLDSNKIPSVTIRDKKGKNKTYTFDKVIVTLPSYLFSKISPELPTEYKDSLIKLRGLGAINLVLRLNKPFFHNNTYWLSVADTKSPIMAIVEHTHFMNKQYYGNEHIIYLGNYLSSSHEYFLKNKQELLKT